MTTQDTVQHLYRERAELLELLRDQRRSLRLTARELTDEQAATRTTVSELSIGGLIKHLSIVEAGWIALMTGNRGHMEGGDAEDWARQFRMEPGETLAGLIESYTSVERATEEAVATLPDLDGEIPLPEAPWFPPGAAWSARRILLHVLRETAQHCGHADIIRESLDGATTTEAWTWDVD